jgi:hydroxyacylglutathione hydrolase
MPPWNVNAGLAVGARKTLVIDTGINVYSAQTIFGYATAVRPSNAVVAVNTEQHLDHIGGNFYFHERGVEVWGHPAIHRDPNDLVEMQSDYFDCISHEGRRALHEEKIFFGETVIMNPSHHLSDGTAFDLGEVTARVLFTPGHTRSNISIFVEGDAVLFGGDCIVGGYAPNLECGDAADWSVWLDSLERLRSLRAVAVVPGHGAVLFDGRVDQEISRMQAVLRRAIQTGVVPTGAKVES